jgi:hypothetical protein
VRSLARALSFSFSFSLAGCCGRSCKASRGGLEGAIVREGEMEGGREKREEAAE